ncbi:hybrid signal transduction histidine kinase M [Tanacetum coccineum]
MTVTPTPPLILLSDKLMTVNNLTTLVFVKLDIDEMNNSSWVYFFKTFIKIFMTLSKTIQARLVVKDPQTAKEAWDLIAFIFNDNKRTRSIALKTELRSLKLGDLSIDAYFRKIESIATILTSLGSPISNDDVVTITLEGLPAKYHNVSGIIVHREPFPDLKTVHSTIKEMRLKSRAQAISIDSTSSSPIVREGKCNESFPTGRSPALSQKWGLNVQSEKTTGSISAI